MYSTKRIQGQIEREGELFVHQIKLLLIVSCHFNSQRNISSHFCRKQLRCCVCVFSNGTYDKYEMDWGRNSVNQRMICSRQTVRSFPGNK